MANLLRNPSFDQSYYAWRNTPDVMVAEGWAPFWLAHVQNDPDWRNRQPFFRPVLRTEDPRRVRSGQAAQVIGTHWATHTAGLMQRVSVGTGQVLRLTAYGHAWSSNGDTPERSLDPGNVRMRVGIDPAGGEDPFAPGVVWSAERAVYDSYDTGFVVEATSRLPEVTVFLYAAPDWPKKHNLVFWDDAVLEVMPQGTGVAPIYPEAGVALSSTTQQVGEPVLIQVSSTHLLAEPVVIVNGPGGPVDAIQLGAGGSGGGQVWRWEFMPRMDGPHTVTLRAEGIQATSATINILPPQPVSSLPHILASTGEADTTRGPAPGRGSPRAQYHRVYVLLPPTAGSDLLRALVESGEWERRRWTVGFSADDAGIGDLAHRSVIVVNPTDWPMPIMPWLEMWYPGLVLYPVTALQPDDLPQLLSELDLEKPPEPD